MANSVGTGGTHWSVGALSESRSVEKVMQPLSEGQQSDPLASETLPLHEQHIRLNPPPPTASTATAATTGNMFSHSFISVCKDNKKRCILAKV